MNVTIDGFHNNSKDFYEAYSSTGSFDPSTWNSNSHITLLINDNEELSEIPNIYYLALYNMVITILRSFL